MLAIAAGLVASAAAILLSVAGMGGFDPSGRAISDPARGTETQPVENPARPEHPAFPPPPANNTSSSSRIDGNDSSAVDGLLESPITAVVFFRHF